MELPERGTPEMLEVPTMGEPPIVVPPIVVLEMGSPPMVVSDKPLNVLAMGAFPVTLLPKVVVPDKRPNVVPAIGVAPIKLLPEKVVVPKNRVLARLGGAKPPMDGREPRMPGASAAVAASSPVSAVETTLVPVGMLLLVTDLPAASKVSASAFVGVKFLGTGMEDVPATPPIEVRPSNPTTARVPAGTIG